MEEIVIIEKKRWIQSISLFQDSQDFGRENRERDDHEQSNETGKLYEILENADRPITGIELSKALDVTRQIIVGDVAILRSSGKPILSTARGYQLQGPAEERGCNRSLHCCSRTMDEDELEAELNAVVDNGGIIRGLTLSHEVYGIIHIDMNIYSRRDVRQYVDKLRASDAPLIVTLTHGAHTLKVETRVDEEMNAVQEGLQELGILA